MCILLFYLFPSPQYANFCCQLILKPINKSRNQTTRFMSFSGVVPENPRIGSDGESEEVSDEVTSPVKLRPRNRRLSEVST